MDQTAFLLIVKPIQENLFRFAYQFFNNEDEARDIVQETLLKLWHNRLQLAEATNKEAWCIKVTKNIILDKVKYNNRRKTENIDNIKEHNYQTTPEPEEQFYLRLIQNAINVLPFNQKLVIQLRDVEGFTYQEIADIMNMDIGNVKVILFRTRKTIREKILKLNAHGL